MKLTTTIRVALITVGLGLGAFAQTARQDIDKAGTDTKNAAKNTGKAAKRTAKKTGKAVKHGTHKAAQGVANKTR